MEVEKQELWGTDSPFNLLEGGEESLVKKLVNVTSDVKQFPVDKAPYSSLLVARLAVQSRSRTSQRPRSRTSGCSSIWTRELLTSKCGSQA